MTPNKLRTAQHDAANEDGGSDLSMLHLSQTDDATANEASTHQVHSGQPLLVPS
jgi:hypothetical protein